MAWKKYFLAKAWQKNPGNGLANTISKQWPCKK
jgi:hypothetical protein